MCCKVWKPEHYVGHLPLSVGLKGASEGTIIDKLHILTSEVVELVQILLMMGDFCLLLGLLYLEDGFKQNFTPILNKLTQGMEVGGEYSRSGEYSLLILALTLTEKLFPPFSKGAELGLISSQELHRFSFVMENIANGSILIAWVIV